MQNGRSSLTSLIPDSNQVFTPVVLSAATTLTASTLKPFYVIDASGGAFAIALPDPATCPGARTTISYKVIGNAVTLTGTMVGAILRDVAIVALAPGARTLTFNSNAATVGCFLELISNGIRWGVTGCSPAYTNNAVGINIA